MLGVVLVLGFGVFGLNWINKNNQNKPVVEYISKVEGNGKIWVDIAGAVERPMVYEMASDSRVKDVLIAAGGLSARADREYVAKNINLAERVKDGEKIYIPEISNSKLQMTNESVQDIGKISVNSASASELEELWGVGEVRAKAIIDGRPYKSLEELVSKKVLTVTIVEKNKDKLSVY